MFITTNGAAKNIHRELYSGEQPVASVNTRNEPKTIKSGICS